MATPVRRLIGIFEIRADKRPMVDATDAMDKGEKQAKKTDDAIKKLMDAFKKLGITLGAGFLLNRIRQFTSDFIKVADALDKTGKQVGIGTDQLQAFRHAADLSGISASEFDQAVGQLQRNMREFTRGSKSMKDAFGDLGVTVTDESGSVLDAGSIMYDIADAMARIEDPAERVGIAMTIFGRSGRRLLPMLIDGSDALRSMTGELETYGGGISQQAIARSVILVDTIARFKLAMRSFASAVAVEVLPKFTEFITAMSRAAVWIKEMIENSHILRATAITAGAALAGIGVATAATWGPAALTVGLTTAAILLLALVIDDLWVTTKGGKSVIRDFLESWLGAEKAAEAVNSISEAVQTLRGYLADLWEIVQRVFGFIFQQREAGQLTRRFVSVVTSEEGPEAEAVPIIGAVRRGGGVGAGVRELAGETEIGAGAITSLRRLFRREEAPRLTRAQQRELQAVTPEMRAQRQLGEAEFMRLIGEAPTPEMARGPLLAPLPQTIQPQVAARPELRQTIDARTSVGQIVIQGVQNPEENARAVRRVIRQHEGERIRQFQATQVPAAERG